MASALNNDPNENVTEETLWNELAQKTRNVILRSVIKCPDGKPKRLSLLRVCTQTESPFLLIKTVTHRQRHDGNSVCIAGVDEREEGD